jgi:hypothetical protein
VNKELGNKFNELRITIYEIGWSMSGDELCLQCKIFFLNQ